MFLPLHDRLPLRRVPVVVLALVAINVAVWLVGLLPATVQGPEGATNLTRGDVWVGEYGLVPCELFGRCEDQPGRVEVDGAGPLSGTPGTVVVRVDDHSPWLALVTSLFVHGSLLHLAANVLVLWVLGDDVEDAMSRWGFTAFYLGAGVLAGLVQSLAAPSSAIPQVGASGAVAAVIGAFIVLLPRAPVLGLLVPPVVLWVPAWVVAGGWAITQLVATSLELLVPVVGDPGVAVANIAHVTGFVVGAATVRELVRHPPPSYERRYGWPWNGPAPTGGGIS